MQRRFVAYYVLEGAGLAAHFREQQALESLLLGKHVFLLPVAPYRLSQSMDQSFGKNFIFFWLNKRFGFHCFREWFLRCLQVFSVTVQLIPNALQKSNQAEGVIVSAVKFGQFDFQSSSLDSFGVGFVACIRGAFVSRCP